MSERIVSRPVSVPTPMPIVTTAMNTAVRSVAALTRTTRWRRFMLEVRPDCEGEGELLDEALAGRRRIARTLSAGRLLQLTVGVAAIRDIVAGRRTRQRPHVRVEIDRTGFAIVVVVADIH